MGCDIHAYREKLVDGKWLTADKWTTEQYEGEDPYTHVDWDDRAYTGRNYQLFGLLSEGVRSEQQYAFAPRGIPFDVCPEIAAHSDRWGIDGHSHSYLYLHELKAFQAFLQNKTLRIFGMKDKQSLAALQASIASGSPDWDLLYPYCAWTSEPNAVEFEIDVPANFYVEACLQKIIDSFEGIEGDNHRFVFFFDN